VSLSRADKAELLLLERLEEQRRQARGVRVDLSEGLFGLQRAVWDAMQPRAWIALRCGRRAGKSHVCSRLLFRGGQEKEGTLNLYVTLTRKEAKRIMWPWVRELARSSFPGSRLNETELVCYMPNGSQVMLGGADDREAIEHYRGPAYYVVVVDECGSMPPFLSYFVDDILEPATIDHRGPIIFAGTPPKTRHGLWAQLCWPGGDTDGHVVHADVHHWTMFDNPHLPHARQDAERIRARRGWGLDHPTWLREYMGVCVVDQEALVYPYDDTLNGINRDQIPFVKQAHGAWDPEWRFVIGVDVGQDSPNAYAVQGAHKNWPYEVLFCTRKVRGQLIDDMADDLRAMLTLYPGARIVLDTGGMGKQHAVELSIRKKIPIEAAEKRDKASAMNIYRDRLMSGQAKIIRGVDNDAWRDEAAVATWNEKRTDLEPGPPDHALDAALYAHRALCHHHYTERDIAPEPGTQEWYADVAARIKRERMREVRRPVLPKWAR